MSDSNSTDNTGVHLASIIAPALAFGATILAKKALTSGYRSMTGKEAPSGRDRTAGLGSVLARNVEHVQDAQQASIVHERRSAGGTQYPIQSGVVLADETDRDRPIQDLVVSSPQLSGELPVAIELLTGRVDADQLQQCVSIDAIGRLPAHRRATFDLTIETAVDTSRTRSSRARTMNITAPMEPSTTIAASDDS